ncbi:hypothetical protein [Helicobacter bilis]|uniref:hypothetical protein n=1 Tax=Helicobacter bilis TaxID=37372 RepID=UPI0003A098D9|nr:hypothetical protein [Helicobacter bilis]
MEIRFFLILYCHVERSETFSMENAKKIQAKIFRLFRHVRTSETLAYTCKYDKNLDS